VRIFLSFNSRDTALAEVVRAVGQFAEKATFSV
jgi:hypothetical protein